jgi:RNA polymerase sigma-70 factor, ECF subfamily
VKRGSFQTDTMCYGHVIEPCDLQSVLGVIVTLRVRISRYMTVNADATPRTLCTELAAELDWDAICTQQLPGVYNFFRYRVRNNTIAEDLTSRTFEKAWRARNSYRSEMAPVEAWLLSIARNVVVDYRRTLHEHAPLELALEEPAAGTPEDDESQRSDFAHLAVLVARMPDREQELLSLKYGAGITNRDIAQVTGLSESNVGTIIHRAVQKLREDW